jgi:hypothetical protein
MGRQHHISFFFNSMNFIQFTAQMHINKKLLIINTNCIASATELPPSYGLSHYAAIKQSLGPRRGLAMKIHQEGCWQHSPSEGKLLGRNNREERMPGAA